MKCGSNGSSGVNASQSLFNSFQLSHSVTFVIAGIAEHSSDIQKCDPILAVLDGFFSLAYLIGLPLGTYLKKHFGYIPLFSTTIIISLVTVLYTVLFISDSFKLVTDEKKKDMLEEGKKNGWNRKKGKTKFVNF